MSSSPMRGRHNKDQESAQPASWARSTTYKMGKLLNKASSKTTNTKPLGMLGLVPWEGGTGNVLEEANFLQQLNGCGAVTVFPEV